MISEWKQILVALRDDVVNITIEIPCGFSCQHLEAMVDSST
jgi:hypothetical protein